MIGGVLLWGLAIGVAWRSYSTSIASFRQQEQSSRAASVSLHQRIAEARAGIQDVRTLEDQAQQVRSEIGRHLQALPEGPAATWMPELLKQHFASFGLQVSIVRMNATLAEPDLTAFQRGYWSVGVPLARASRSATGPLLATAELERHPFVKVLDFAIRPDPERPEDRIAVLNVAALVRK